MASSGGFTADGCGVGRSLANGGELFAWLQDGGHFYVDGLITTHRYLRDVY